MNEHQAFLSAIHADPEDETTRLVYADWLEERGDPRGEYLRLDCALQRMSPEDEHFSAMVTRFRRLREEIDTGWARAVARSPVENCKFRFAFRCPKQWDKLTATENEAVRFCATCRSKVFYCDTIDEARHHAGLGHCVALDGRVERSSGDLKPDLFAEEEMVMGFMDPEPTAWRSPASSQAEGVPLPPVGLVRRVSGWVRGIASRFGLGGERDRFWREAAPGQQVSVRRGPFAGLQGEIERVDRSGRRATVLIEMFGGRVLVELDQEDMV
jgi:uncharacterized protein (TIGR02996 family)